MTRTYKPLAPTPLTIRMQEEDLAWLSSEAETRGVARTDIIRALVTDARHCFGLPVPIRDLIVTAAQDAGLSVRDYTIELLRNHARGLRRDRTPRSPTP